MNKISEFTELIQPFFHLTVMEKSEFQDFFSAIKGAMDKHVVVKHIEGSICTTLDELFAEFAKVLKFPDYFGNNWAAFDECLNDLDWFSAESYLLLISDIDQVVKKSDSSFMTLIEILQRSVKDWTEGRHYDAFPTPPTPFHVVFQCSSERENEVRSRFEMTDIKSVDLLKIS